MDLIDCLQHFAQKAAVHSHVKKNCVEDFLKCKNVESLFYLYTYLLIYIYDMKAYVPRMQKNVLAVSIEVLIIWFYLSLMYELSFYYGDQ
jgi:hypothetical protein